jgi:flagellar hook-associated protein 3 FlgL
MRVISQMGSLNAGEDLARIYRELARREREATSGSRLERPSTDPTAAAQLVRTDADALCVDQCRANLDQAQGELQAADSVLESVSDLLVRARELAVAMGSGSVTADERAAAAEEIRGIREQVLALANTDQGGVHLFAGYLTDRDPYDASGTPVGDISGVRRVLAAPGEVAEAGVSGAEVFTVAGGHDLFADLDALASSLAANDQVAVRAAVDTMAACHEQVSRARATAGVRAAHLIAISDRLASRALVLDEERSRIADADPVQTLSALAQAQSALNAALRVSAEMLTKLSLVDKL